MDSKLSLILLAACLSAALAAEKIPITIYFESLCSDSQAFITKQFNDAYKKAKEEITPDFVPFGHANITDGKMQCQHGDYECDGNKILGCAVNLMKNKTDDLVTFVNCIMALDDLNLVNKNRTDNVSFPLDKCKKEAGTFYENITKCWNGTDGQNIIEGFEKRTKDTFKENKFGVPYVIYNNTGINDALSQNFTKNFLTTLCDVSGSQNKTLKACDKSSASTLVASLIPAVLAVFIARL